MEIDRIWTDGDPRMKYSIDGTEFYVRYRLDDGKWVHTYNGVWRKENTCTEGILLYLAGGDS